MSRPHCPKIVPEAAIDVLHRHSSYSEAVVVRPAKAGASSGRQSHRGKSRSPVAWVAGSREIEILKPTDKCHRRMAASHSVVAQANERWPRNYVALEAELSMTRRRQHDR